MLRLTIIVACAIVLLSASIVGGAAVPQKINYQAVLLDELGDPVTDPVDLTFRIYPDTLGAPSWSQTINGVQPDANGQFSVVLGEDMNWIDHDVLTGEQLWLSVEVGTEGEMHPFTELVSSAYSFRVNTVDQAEAGTIYGPLTIEESQSKLADARVIVTCAAKAPETVEISPCDGIILRATNQTDDEILLAEVDDVNQDALLTMTDPGTDAQAAYSASAAEFGTSVAKALQKKYVYGGEGLKQLGASETDILGEWAEMAPGQTYIGMTDYSAKAAGASLKIRPPSADLADVFTVQNSVGDPLFNLESDPDSGASISFYTPSLARASVEKTKISNLGLSFFGADKTEELLMVEEETPGVVSITGTDYSAKALGASVKIKPPTASQAEVFTVSTSTGDPAFQLESDPSVGASMSFYSTAAKASTKGTEINEQGYFAFGATADDTAVAISDRSITVKSSAAKLGDWIKINSEGIFFVNAAKGETLMTITADGNVIGKGQIAMGQNMSNDGDFANVLGFGNTASGDSAAVTGGHENSATATASIVAGGARNVASGMYSFAAGVQCSSSYNYATVSGGTNNKATQQQAVVAGGRNNRASGSGSSVGGGVYNTASGTGSVVCGGYGSGPAVGNVASGQNSVVPGGTENEAGGSTSFAAGFRATIASDHHGTFVWADQSVDEDFASTGMNQFLIRASGGVGIGKGDPTSPLDIKAANQSSDGGLRITSNTNSNMIIGLHDAGPGDAGMISVRAGGANKIILRADGDSYFLGGQFGIGVSSPTRDLDVAGTARLRGIGSTVVSYNPVVVDADGVLREFTAKSSSRYKEDVRELEVDPEKVLQMQPVRFAWKENGMEDVGLIAEDVAKLIPDLVIYDDENRPDGLKYDKVVFYLLAALKDLKAENDALKAHQTKTDAQLSQLTELVETILASQGDSKSGDEKLTLNR